MRSVRRGINFSGTPVSQGSGDSGNTAKSDGTNLMLGTAEQQEREADLQDRSAGGVKHKQNAATTVRQDGSLRTQAVEQIDGTDGVGEVAEALQEQYAQEPVDRARQADEMLPDAQDQKTHAINSFNHAIEESSLLNPKFTGHVNEGDLTEAITKITPSKQDDKMLAKARRRGAVDALSGDAIDTIAAQGGKAADVGGISKAFAAEASSGLEGIGIGGDKRLASQDEGIGAQIDAKRGLLRRLEAGAILAQDAKIKQREQQEAEDEGVPYPGIRGIAKYY